MATCPLPKEATITSDKDANQDGPAATPANASRPAALPRLADLWRDPLTLLAFGFGAGCAPRAPGTFGTLLAVPLFMVCAGLSLPLYLLTCLLVFVLGWWACQHASRRLGVHDHSGIVIDEVAGYLVTMIGAPLDLYWILAGFILFRGFDIIKPWPIGWLDRHVHTGFGIMIDDIAAGIMALACLQALAYAAGHIS